MAEGSPVEQPTAELWPSMQPRAEEDAILVKVYVVTGKHGVFSVPEGFCRECNLFVRAADIAAERVDHPVNVRVLSWWTRFLGALRHGGYHPPVMVVGGTMVAQGHDVPHPDDVVKAIEAAAAA